MRLTTEGERQMIPYLNKGQGNTLIDDQKDVNDEDMVYRHESMAKLIKIINKVASTDASVLLIGKSGTGKELMASKIHQLSYRKNKPFTVINCSYLSDNLANSELFGYEKEAFTGANRQTIGLLEKSHKGTIVLDEIGDLKPETQAKLLKFLQENEIYRVGSKTPIHLDVRVVCITNKNLAEEVVQGRFREDLFYRINTITLEIPSLSERREDIPVLLEHFLGPYVKIAPDAMSILTKYNWPGNVRELQNLCSRWRILKTENRITINDLPKSLLATNPYQNVGIEYDPSMSLAEMNKIYILHALEHFTSKREAAKALGITIKTLYNRLHDYGVFEQYAMHSTPLESNKSLQM